MWFDEMIALFLRFENICVLVQLRPMYFISFLSKLIFSGYRLTSFTMNMKSIAILEFPDLYAVGCVLVS